MRLWVIAGVLSAAGAAAVPVINAHADNYPPQQGIVVTVDQAGKSHTYKVSVAYATYGCIFRVVSGDYSKNTKVKKDGTATVTLNIGKKTGTRTILAKTISCADKQEATPQTVVVASNKYTGPKTARLGELITFKALGWNPNYPVAFTLTNASNTLSSGPLTPNSTGNAFWKTLTPPAGTYAVIVTQKGTPTQVGQIVIKPQK
jgi:hypothetical protein